MPRVPRRPTPTAPQPAAAATSPGCAARLSGHKAHLPWKPCQACGRPMSWRRRWARTWDEVRYCSDACRRKVPPHHG